jgi:hypothetical protein
VVDKLDNEMNNQEQNEIEVEDDDNSIDVDSAMISDIDSDSSNNGNNSEFQDDESNTLIIEDTEDDMEILHSNSDMTNDDTDSRDNADRIKEREDKETVDQFLGIRAMPDNATFFELFKAQIQADFAPFLIIIPKPIKKLISKNAKILGKKIRVAIQGPLTPFVIVASKLLKLLGNGIIYIGDDIVKLSSFLSTFDDSELRQKLRSEKQMGSQIMLRDESLQNNLEEIVDVIDMDDRELVDNTEDRDIIDSNSDSVGDRDSYSSLIEEDSIPKDSSKDELHSVIEDYTNIVKEQILRDSKDGEDLRSNDGEDERLVEVVGEGDSTEGIERADVEEVMNSQRISEDEGIDNSEDIVGDEADSSDEIEGDEIEV